MQRMMISSCCGHNVMIHEADEAIDNVQVKGSALTRTTLGFQNDAGK